MTSEIKQRTVYKLVRTDKPEDGTFMLAVRRGL